MITTLTELIAAHNGDRLAVGAPNREWMNYDGLRDLAKSVSSQLRTFGIGAKDRVATLRRSLAAGGRDCVAYFEREAEERSVVFGALRALQAGLAAGLLDAGGRERLFADLASLASEYPELLARQKFDLAVSPHAPMVAAQFWVVVKSTLADTRQGRVRVADALEFAGGYRDLHGD